MREIVLYDLYGRVDRKLTNDVFDEPVQWGTDNSSNHHFLTNFGEILKKYGYMQKLAKFGKIWLNSSSQKIPYPEL